MFSELLLIHMMSKAGEFITIIIKSRKAGVLNKIFPKAEYSAIQQDLATLILKYTRKE